MALTPILANRYDLRNGFPLISTSWGWQHEKAPQPTG